MPKYSAVAWKRAMKVQEVILGVMAKKITWWQAAEIVGLSDRGLRRWRERYEEQGYDGVGGPAAREAEPETDAPGAGGRTAAVISGEVCCAVRQNLIRDECWRDPPSSQLDNGA